MVEMGGTSARIEARGDRIVVELPSLRDGISTLGRWPKGRGRREAIRRIHEGLTAAGLTLEVVVGPSTIAVLGVGARPGRTSRLLGLDALEVRVGGLLGSLRRPLDRPER